MKTLVGRFPTATDAAQAQASLVTRYTTAPSRGSTSNRVAAATALCVVGGAIFGFLAANGTVANWGITLDGGKSYLGVMTNDPLMLFGYTALGLAMGIPFGLILGMFTTMLPQRGALPFRVAALVNHGQTVIVQTDNRHAQGIAQVLSDSQAQRVQTLDGRIDPVQVSSALDQLARQS
jgi:hypothetical protein